MLSGASLLMVAAIVETEEFHPTLAFEVCQILSFVGTLVGNRYNRHPRSESPAPHSSQIQTPTRLSVRVHQYELMSAYLFQGRRCLVRRWRLLFRIDRSRYNVAGYETAEESGGYGEHDSEFGAHGFSMRQENAGWILVRSVGCVNVPYR